MKLFSITRIRTKLLVAFILTGLIPLGVASVGGGGLAMEALLEKSFSQLQNVQAIRKGQVENAVQERIDDVKVLALNRDVKDLLRLLEDYGRQQKLGQQDPFPVQTEAWRKITQGYDKIFQEAIAAYGFHDMAIISASSGRVMYSVAKEGDLGANLEFGRLRDSGLGKAWREAVQSGQLGVADFSAYQPSGGVQSAFFAQPVLGPDGSMAGVLAVQLQPSFVAEMMNAREGMGETGESYLFGRDPFSGKLAFRSEMKTMGQGLYKVGYTPDFTLSYWDAAMKSGQRGGVGEFTDSAGAGVLAAYSALNIPGLEWYLISKINKREVMAPVRTLALNAGLTALVLAALIGLTAVFISRNFTRPILRAADFAHGVAEGKFDAMLEEKRQDELGRLAESLNVMTANLALIDWHKTGKESLDDAMRGDLGVRDLSSRFIAAVTKQLGGSIGAFYVTGEDGVLTLTASYAFMDRQGNFNHIWPGEGLIGQAVLEKKTIVFSNVTEAAPMINYGAGETKPNYYLIAPFVVGDEVLGVFLVGSVNLFEERHRAFVERNLADAAVQLGAAKSRRMVRELLKQAQSQQEKLAAANADLEEQAKALKESEAELQAQQEELRVTNEELEEQTRALKESQAELQAQQEELQVINEELEERTKALSEQKERMKTKNLELVKAQTAINHKAQELEVASKYKSEFLANMSHELRTPLNSILILSQIFSGNRDGNLTSKQVEAAQAIHSSGSELLKLINDILDLSKVEAGKIELQVGSTQMEGFLGDLRRVFKDLAEDKGVSFVIEQEPGTPDAIKTDPHRLQQVLRNLLSNAFKFTAEGTVSLTVRRPQEEEIIGTGLTPASSMAFSVRDQGIGIPEDKQALIFEAFKQADGSTSRTYGGTGLGLSISRELTKLLGGVIRLRSKEGEGSEFTIVLPVEYAGPASSQFTAVRSLPADSGEPDAEEFTQDQPQPAQPAPPAAPEPRRPTPAAKPKTAARPSQPDQANAEQAPAASRVKDDRRNISPGDKTLLIIEDDPHFCAVLLDLAHERGFKCLIAEDGETGLHFADFHRPSAIILDIGLPGIDGWTVMERLKSNPDTRHIPVHFMSAADTSLDALRMGAVGFLTKPVSLDKIDQAMTRIESILSRRVGRLLVVEDDEVQREAIKSLIGGGDVEITAVGLASEAFTELRSSHYDCMILDLGLSDISGFDLLETIRTDQSLPRVPIIVYTGRDITQDEERKLHQYAESIIIKGARSPERLMEETALFLHRVESSMPKDPDRPLRLNHDKDAVLAGRRVLLTDDDMRNVFALTSLLEEKGIEPIIARNGQECLDRLNEHPDVELILMDIMMPKMDGYEAMRAIRKDSRFKKLPIIALTAKAMAGDRAKCIEAGASDYLAKPVNTDKLISMLRVWLYK